MSTTHKVFRMTDANKLGAQICKVLGVDPELCTAVTMTVTAEGEITVLVNMLPPTPLEDIDWKQALPEEIEATDL